MGLIPLANPSFCILSLSRSKLTTHFQKNNAKKASPGMTRQENQPRPSLTNRHEHQKHKTQQRSWFMICARSSLNSQLQTTHFILLRKISHTRFRKTQHLALTHHWTTDFRGSFIPCFLLRSSSETDKSQKGLPANQCMPGSH